MGKEPFTSAPIIYIVPHNGFLLIKPLFVSDVWWSLQFLGHFGHLLPGSTSSSFDISFCSKARGLVDVQRA